MIEFLTILLTLVLGFGAFQNLPTLGEDIISKLPSQVAEVASPEADPAGVIETKLSDFSTSNTNLPEPFPAPEIPEPMTAELPETEKVAAYNTKSEKPVGKVAAVAVEKAEPLVSCSEVGQACEEPLTEPNPNIPEQIPPVETGPVTPPVVNDPPVTQGKPESKPPVNPAPPITLPVELE